MNILTDDIMPAHWFEILGAVNKDHLDDFMRYCLQKELERYKHYQELLREVARENLPKFMDALSEDAACGYLYYLEHLSDGGYIKGVEIHEVETHSDTSIPETGYQLQYRLTVPRLTARGYGLYNCLGRWL